MRKAFLATLIVIGGVGIIALITWSYKVNNQACEDFYGSGFRTTYSGGYITGCGKPGSPIMTFPF